MLMSPASKAKAKITNAMLLVEQTTGSKPKPNSKPKKASTPTATKSKTAPTQQKKKPAKKKAVRKTKRVQAPQSIDETLADELVELLKLGLAAYPSGQMKAQLDFLSDTCVVRLAVSDRVWQKIGEGDWHPGYVNELMERQFIEFELEARMGTTVKLLSSLTR
jgi:hypothetical protein